MWSRQLSSFQTPLEAVFDLLGSERANGGLGMVCVDGLAKRPDSGRQTDKRLGESLGGMAGGKEVACEGDAFDHTVARGEM